MDPEVDRYSDTGHTTFVDLMIINITHSSNSDRSTYHLGCFGTSNCKLEVGILLPVSEKEWKFCEEAIVDVSSGSDGLRT